MKLFIERLSTLFRLSGFVLIVVGVIGLMIAFTTAYPLVGNILGMCLFAFMLIVIIIDVFRLLRWLIIEPFFTKKGADRK
nr:MAG TPA: transmembrane protein [Caudoviricetes sp.]